jgi:hypothetical protein
MLPPVATDGPTQRESAMGSNSRYDRDRPVGDREAAEARALHLIGELVGNYPGISDPHVAGQISHVLHATAIELGNGRSVPIEVHRARARRGAATRDAATHCGRWTAWGRRVSPSIQVCHYVTAPTLTCENKGDSAGDSRSDLSLNRL